MSSARERDWRGDTRGMPSVDPCGSSPLPAADSSTKGGRGERGAGRVRETVKGKGEGDGESQWSVVSDVAVMDAGARQTVRAPVAWD
eukprot:197208-Rhodomonas_salina.1